MSPVRLIGWSIAVIICAGALVAVAFALMFGVAVYEALVR